jgi:hypothetical protein
LIEFMRLRFCKSVNLKDREKSKSTVQMVRRSVIILSPDKEAPAQKLMD